MSKLSSKLTQKLKASFLARTVTYAVIAFIVSLILCTILITLGYFSLRGSGAPSYQVAFFGLPIYEIVRSGNSLAGRFLITNMVIIGVGCAYALMVITELVLALKKKSKKKECVLLLL